MSFFMPILISTMAGLATIAGAIPIIHNWKEKTTNRLITLSLSLSFTIMLGISIFELMPEGTYIMLKKYQFIYGSINSILLFLLSIQIMKIIGSRVEKGKDLYHIGMMSMITLMIHNIPEGIITFYSTQQSLKLGIQMGLSILMHNIPEGISIAMPIYFGTKKKKIAFLYTLIAGLAEPIGAILAYIIFGPSMNELLLGILFILTAGFMITLAIDHLIPKSLQYQDKKSVIIGILIGGSVFLISKYFLN